MEGSCLEKLRQMVLAYGRQRLRDLGVKTERNTNSIDLEGGGLESYWETMEEELQALHQPLTFYLEKLLEDLRDRLKGRPITNLLVDIRKTGMTVRVTYCALVDWKPQEGDA